MFVPLVFVHNRSELDARLKDLGEQLADVVTRARQASLECEAAGWELPLDRVSKCTNWAFDLAPIQGELAFLRKSAPEGFLRCLDWKSRKADREGWEDLAIEFRRIRRCAEKLLRKHERMSLTLLLPYVPGNRLAYSISFARNWIRRCKRFGRRTALEYPRETDGPAGGGSACVG